MIELTGSFIPGIVGDKECGLVISAVAGDTPERIGTSRKVTEKIPLVALIEPKTRPALPDGIDIVPPVVMVKAVKELPERIIGASIHGIEIPVPGKLQYRQVIFPYPLKICRGRYPVQ